MKSSQCSSKFCYFNRFSKISRQNTICARFLSLHYCKCSSRIRHLTIFLPFFFHQFRVICPWTAAFFFWGKQLAYWRAIFLVKSLQCSSRFRNLTNFSFSFGWFAHVWTAAIFCGKFRNSQHNCIFNGEQYRQYHRCCQLSQQSCSFSGNHEFGWCPWWTG